MLSKIGKYIAEKVYKNLEKGSGHMILATTVTGIALSCLAQTAAIMFNKQYSVSQKAFMVPQEITEGLVSVVSMFAISRPTQYIAKKYAKSGKILTKDMLNYMKKHSLIEKRGNMDFDFGKEINKIIHKIEQSDKYIKSSDIKKESLLKEHNEILNQFNETEDATSAIATTAGTAISTAFISPLLRNYSASYYQKINLDYYNNLPDTYKQQAQSLRRPFSYNVNYSSTGVSKI